MLELDVTLQRMEGRRVLVVGDVICDYYVYGVAERISREAPVLILRYEGDAVHPGGAANAACNVRSLGGRALLVGALGRDALGRRVLQSLRALGLDTDAVVVDRDGSTAVKTRILAGARQALRQQVVRVDRAGPPSLPHAVEERLLALLTTHIGDCDAVLIADYGLGTVTPRLAAAALSLARRHGRPVAVDSRHRLLSFGGVDVATPNKVEAVSFKHIPAHQPQANLR
ncbi:MAG: carbohydrate kinase, partial [Clostridia bacterium]|nr:carbohydrate kinase [Clostridia bacterium]